MVSETVNKYTKITPILLKETLKNIENNEQKLISIYFFDDNENVIIVKPYKPFVIESLSF